MFSLLIDKNLNNYNDNKISKTTMIIENNILDYLEILQGYSTF
jgi:hypothetical protein